MGISTSHTSHKACHFVITAVFDRLFLFLVLSKKSYDRFDRSQTFLSCRRDPSPRPKHAVQTIGIVLQRIISFLVEQKRL